MMQMIMFWMDAHCRVIMYGTVTLICLHSGMFSCEAICAMSLLSMAVCA